MEKLAVILPIYNAEKYLVECLDSLFNQTFKDFFVIAINDASTDNTRAILDRYAQGEPRLKIYHFEENKGDPKGTQFAFNMLNDINVEYVARMDADDICLPERFEKQIAFLDQNPDIDVLGTNILQLLQSGEEISPKRIIAIDEQIKAAMIMASPIANPTSMWRHQSIKEVNLKYDIYPIACDYAMWAELAIQGKKFANLQDALLKYRIHPKQTSRKSQLMRDCSISISTRYLMNVFKELNITECSLLARLFFDIQFTNLEFQMILYACSKIKKNAPSVLGENRKLMLKFINDKVIALKEIVNASPKTI